MRKKALLLRLLQRKKKYNLIKVKILNNVFNLSNRTALKLLAALQKDLELHLSTHCIECDSEFSNENKGIPYQSISPDQSGYICERCAEKLFNPEFTVEGIDNCD